MVSKLRSRMTFSNVVSLLALFVALGGTGAYAANTIFSEDIVDGEVHRQDLANDAVATAKILDLTVGPQDLRTGAVTTSKVALGAVTNNRLADNGITGGRSSMRA
jgi:hypothetical protein